MQTRPLSKCMLLACAYQRTKENGHCQKKILPRLWTTIWQRGTLWKTLFQNKSSGTINPVYLPQKTPEQHKECVNQQNTVYLNSCPNMSYPATLKEHPINNNDLDRVALAQHLLYHSKGEMLRRNNQKDIAKEQGHGRKTHKVFSLNSFLLIWGR